MLRCFLRVSKTHNKKVAKATPQKADARDYEKRRIRRKFSSLKRAIWVLEMMTREWFHAMNQTLRFRRKVGFLLKTPDINLEIKGCVQALNPLTVMNEERALLVCPSALYPSFFD